MVEANKEAVIAIQGGGVYALSLLGQAQAVFEHGYVPLAFAGTSGGAILASLLWSGLSPRQIQAEFTTMVQRDPAALVNLLSPFEPPPDPHFDFNSFLNLQERVTAALQSMPSSPPEKVRFWRHPIKRARALGSGAAAAWDVWGIW